MEPGAAGAGGGVVSGVEPAPDDRVRVGALRRFKPYRAYKDSSVEWLGEIPAHWEVKRLWHLTPSDRRIMYGIVLPGPNVDVGVPIVKGGDVSPERLHLDCLNRTTRKIESGYARSRLRGGDLVYAIRGSIGEVAIVPDEIEGANLTQDAARVAYTTATHGRWLLHALKSTAVFAQLEAGALGATIRGINIRDLKRASIAVPPHAEQRAIAAFLDRETARIDMLVAKKERLIELLQEKRTALITRAVTKGLDPNVPMMDSGVDWLGGIPVHWEVKRTKFVARLRSGHTPSRLHPEYWQECTIPWFGLADVWQIRDGQVEYVSETAEKISELGLANSAARLLPMGTVILSRTASVGFSAIMGIDMATTQDFVNWVCGPTIRPEYLLYVFRSMGHEFKRLTMGSTHQTIYMPDVGAFSTPLPPVLEQDQIVAFVRRNTARIDSLVAKVREAVDRLKELRTALNSAAVTGKIDVQGEVA